MILRADGALLLAERPADKPWSGWWELPGGKIEAGETVLQALARELDEELGIQITQATPWVTHVHEYPKNIVSLAFCRVTGWNGTPTGREGQTLALGRSACAHHCRQAAAGHRAAAALAAAARPLPDHIHRRAAGTARLSRAAGRGLAARHQAGAVPRTRMAAARRRAGRSLSLAGSATALPRARRALPGE